MTDREIQGWTGRSSCLPRVHSLMGEAQWSAHTFSNVMGAARGGRDGACCGLQRGEGPGPRGGGAWRRVRDVFSEEVTFNADRSLAGKNFEWGAGHTQRPMEWESLRPGDPQVLLICDWPRRTCPQAWTSHPRDIFLKDT